MANVKLSNAEMNLVCNANFILTKNAIIEKVYALFGVLSTHYVELIKQTDLQKEISETSPKISRGENYEGLPWVMLDYPRYFKNNDFFSVRTFFWWGNFISITLLLKGKYKERFEVLSYRLQTEEDWFLCVNENEWQHHFREDNYQLLSSFTDEKINALPFIKLAKKIPLEQWDDVENNMKKYFNELLTLTSQPMK